MMIEFVKVEKVYGNTTELKLSEILISSENVSYVEEDKELKKLTEGKQITLPVGLQPQVQFSKIYFNNSTMVTVAGSAQMVKEKLNLPFSKKILKD